MNLKQTQTFFHLATAASIAFFLHIHYFLLQLLHMTWIYFTVLISMSAKMEIINVIQLHQTALILMAVTGEKAQQ